MKNYPAAAFSVTISFLKWPFQKELYVKLFLLFLPKRARSKFEEIMLG
jgi:hypothetical protein